MESDFGEQQFELWHNPDYKSKRYYLHPAVYLTSKTKTHDDFTTGS